ncbi:unnamed protein product, partial [Didymodactylos carnosus]
KKDDGIRFLVDYQKLNSVTKKDSFSQPITEELLHGLGGNCYYTKFNLKSGYFQIKIQELDEEKTIFVTQDGLWEFNILSQGVMNGPPTFHRVMHNLIANGRWDYVVVYLDDILIFSKTFEDNKRHLSEILSILQKANFQDNLEKCFITVEEIEFLSYTINHDFIRPSQKKIHDIIGFKPPKTLNEADGFIGKLNWYRTFIPDFARTAPQSIKQRIKQKRLMDASEEIALLVITMNVNFELRWCDSLLIWNTSEYPCILSPDKQNSQIFFNAKEIWTPDITPINSPATLAKDQKLNYPVLSVCSDNIRWNYPEKLQTFCEINVKYFPFDRQRCSILLQSTIYDSSQMKLKTLYNFVRLYNYIKTEYSIIDASIHEIDLYNMYHKRNFSTLRIDIELERFSRFYTFKIVLPYFIISSLALFSFCLPIDTGEKVTLTVSVLLSLTIYLQLISDYVPKTEQGVCTLTLYCNFVFILVFLSCVCNTFIIFVYYTTSNTERRFILLKTGKMKKKKTMKKKKKRRQDNNGNMMSTIYKSIINLNRQRMKMNETKTDIIENEDNINAIELLNDIKYLKEILTHMYKQTCSTTTTEYNQINIIEQYDYFQIRQKSRIDNNKTEFNTYLTKHFSYKQLAIILDRILFIIYLIIMSLTGILFLNVQHSRSYALNGNRTSQLYDLRKKSTAIPLPLFRGCPK